MGVNCQVLEVRFSAGISHASACIRARSSGCSELFSGGQPLLFVSLHADGRSRCGSPVWWPVTMERVRMAGRSRSVGRLASRGKGKARSVRQVGGMRRVGLIGARWRFPASQVSLHAPDGAEDEGWCRSMWSLSTRGRGDSTCHRCGRPSDAPTPGHAQAPRRTATASKPDSPSARAVSDLRLDHPGLLPHGHYWPFVKAGRISTTTEGRLGLVRHIHEARVVALERHHNGLRRTIAVLGDDHVGLADPVGVFLVVVVVAVDQDDHVGILLQ